MIAADKTAVSDDREKRNRVEELAAYAERKALAASLNSLLASPSLPVSGERSTEDGEPRVMVSTTASSDSSSFVRASSQRLLPKPSNANKIGYEPNHDA
jgi:hypothetical protein